MLAFIRESPDTAWTHPSRKKRAAAGMAGAEREGAYIFADRDLLFV